VKVDFKLFLLAVSVIVIVVLLHRSCDRDTITTTETKTIVRIDTLRHRDTIYFPKPYKVVVRQIDTLYIDTSKVIRDYFTEKYYRLSYSDTTLQATADIVVAENSLELAQLDYLVFRPTIHTITTIKEKTYRRFFLSLGVGANYNIRNNKAGVELLSTIGIKRHSLHLGYDFINQTPRLGWQYQIIR